MFYNNWNKYILTEHVYNCNLLSFPIHWSSYLFNSVHIKFYTLVYVYSKRDSSCQKLPWILNLNNTCMQMICIIIISYYHNYRYWVKQIYLTIFCYTMNTNRFIAVSLCEGQIYTKLKKKPTQHDEETGQLKVHLLWLKNNLSLSKL